MAERGSDFVLQAMADDRDWTASELARTEARLALCRRGPEGAFGAPVQKQLADEFDTFFTVALDAQCLRDAEDIGCEHRLRTLDAIHLAAAVRLNGARFLSYDMRQVDAARALGLEVVPT